MEAAPADESCGVCRFYLGGRCHLNPPSMMLYTTHFLLADAPDRYTVEFPPVADSDWCGHFLKLTPTPVQKVAPEF
jgi:hypothetical protein